MFTSSYLFAQLNARVAEGLIKLYFMEYTRYTEVGWDKWMPWFYRILWDIKSYQRIGSETHLSAYMWLKSKIALRLLHDWIPFSKTLWLKHCGLTPWYLTRSLYSCLYFTAAVMWILPWGSTLISWGHQPEYKYPLKEATFNLSHCLFLD